PATSSMIAATAASTSAALSRFAVSSARNPVSKPGSRVFRVTGMGGAGRLSGRGGRDARGLRDLRIGLGAEPLDPAADLLRPGFQRRAIDDQPRGYGGDVLDLGEAVRLQCRAGLHQIDDVAAQPE